MKIKLEKYPNLSAYIARGEASARLQVCFRRSIGGFHRQAIDRLINVRSGLEAVIALVRNLMGPDPNVEQRCGVGFVGAFDHTSS